VPNPPLYAEAIDPIRLRHDVSGRVIDRSDADYDSARTLFYHGFDRRPEVIVRPADVADVARVIRFAREAGAALAVRSGGHSLAGHGASDGGVVLDLSSLKRLAIDPSARTAWAETGLTTGEFTAAAGAYGLATCFGDSPSVGIGGITLGGGVGYLHRTLGLTIDSLLAADIVTADGDVVRADAEHHADLFWAIRGGGGNFGVATRFLYRLHEVDAATGGMLILPASAEGIARFISAMQEAPEELSGLVNVMIAPPMPFIPAEHHGTPVMLALLMHVGAAEAGERALAPLRSVAPPIADMIRPMRFAQIYEGEGQAPHPARMVARSFFTDEVDRDAGEAILEQLRLSRAPMKVAQFRVLGGAVARVPSDATAFAHRDRGMMAITAAAFEQAEEAEEHGDWATRFADALRRGGRGAYVGFLGEEGERRVREAYPDATWERLRNIKRRYDPGNLFRLNQNIPPAAGRG
jgi:FAD/FMN-containing dehydrogenase